MMIIGTKSGKTFSVEDECYQSVDDMSGDITHTFLTKDRIITIRDWDIEYWDEERTDDHIAHLDGMDDGCTPLDRIDVV